MRLHFFTVPIHDDGTASQVLNRFLAANRVIDVERHLIPDGSRSVWVFCVTTAAPPTVSVPPYREFDMEVETVHPHRLPTLLAGHHG